MALRAKRALSCLLTVLMLLMLLPMNAFAAGNPENPFGIEGEGVTATEISEDEISYNKLSEEAEKRAWGLYLDLDLYQQITFGRIHSAYHITSTEPYVTITMDTPTQVSESNGGDEFPEYTVGWAVLALIDGEIVTYPTTKLDNDKLQCTVRLGKNGTDLALACLVDASEANAPIGDYGTLTLEPEEIQKDESLGYVRPYKLTYKMSEGIKELLQSPGYHPGFDLTFYLSSKGLKIDAESISFDENPIFELDSEETEKLADGSYKFTVHVDIDAWAEGDFSDVVGISYAAPNVASLLFEGEMHANGLEMYPNIDMSGCVPLTITVVEPPEDVETYHKIAVTQTDGGEIEPHGVEGEVWVKEGEKQTFTIKPDKGYHIKDVVVNGESQGAITEYTFANVTDDNNTITATFAKNPAVTVTPADLTIYMGGDGGYDAVVGEDGEIASSTNSLPHPLFKVTMPEDSSVDPTTLTFTNGMSGEDAKTWTLVCDNPDSNGEKYYHFSEGEGQDKVRVTYTYTDKNGKEHVVTNDTFDPAVIGDVFAICKIAIYPGENDLSTIIAEATDGKEYNVSAGTGTLTVRAVEDSDATTNIVGAVPVDEVSSGKAVAVAPAGTTYTLNETGVPLPSDSEPSLLFDSIIEDANSTERTDALEDRIQTEFGEDTAVYEIKYLDLVDANNGNAWIKASEPVDIYWGYPDGTTQDTKFTVVHFKDLHRDGDQSGYDTADIASCKVETIEAESTAQGIKFSVQPGQFSPFALVQEIAEEPEPIPTPDPGDDDNPPYIPPVDPDDTGVSDLLNTEDHIQYLFGYPNGTFGPENDMTRAEVAQMFYNLLLDQDVTITKTFEDVPEDAWYAKAVNTLASLGVVSGVGDNKFEPERSITRAEFTTITMRFTNGMMDGENIFPDVNADDWFYDYVVGSIQYGWIHGYPDGTFRPNNPITRAEVTAIVNNMLGREADEDFVDEHAEELTPFSDIEKHWAYYHIAEATNGHDYTMPSSGENWTRLN